MDKTKYKSQCCDAEPRTVGTSEGTYYMVCSKCEKEFIAKADMVEASELNTIIKEEENEIKLHIQLEKLAREEFHNEDKDIIKTKILCSKHNIVYFLGGKCPECERKHLDNIK
jgi:hypothetical protein